jgi:heme-degrading monooxygenase HmoA
MTTLSVHHKIADYSKWRAVFDGMDSLRRQFGETSFRVFHSASDPLDITVHTEWPSVDAARAYATSPDLKAGMQNAGVVSQPDIAFLETL